MQDYCIMHAGCKIMYQNYIISRSYAARISLRSKRGQAKIGHNLTLAQAKYMVQGRFFRYFRVVLHLEIEQDHLLKSAG